MKKILFVLPSLRVGGMERVQVNIANALAKHGYDVTVMTLEPENDLIGELSDKVHYAHKPYKPHPIMSRIPYIRHKFYDDGMWETRATPEKLYKYYVGKEKYDVEIGFFRGLPIKIISGSMNKNSIKLAWVHTDFRKTAGYKNNFKNMQAAKSAYSKFEKVVCVSNQAIEGFKEVIGDTGNLTAIYNFLPVERILSLSEKEPEINIKKSKFNIVLVGRLLDKAKGQVRLIRAVSKLHNAGYDISLTLVGGGKDEQIIKDEIVSNSSESYIFMTGNQINPYPYIKRANLLVCASYFEGFNLTVAEALVLGTPVLSTHCTGPTEILADGKYGKIVENSEEGLFNGIKELIDNPKMLENYMKTAKSRGQDFSEEKIIKEIIGLIKG